MSSQDDSHDHVIESFKESSRLAVSSTTLNIGQTSSKDRNIDPVQVRHARDTALSDSTAAIRERKTTRTIISRQTSLPSARVLETDTLEESQIATENVLDPDVTLPSAPPRSKDDTKNPFSSNPPHSPISHRERRIGRSKYVYMPNINIGPQNPQPSTSERRGYRRCQNCFCEDNRLRRSMKDSLPLRKQCGYDCPCHSRQLIFPQRIRNIPTVRILRKVYGNVRASNSLLGCALAAMEVAALCTSAPAAAAWHLLPYLAATPLRVADLLLCKGLDMAERALPCLTQTPKQMCEGVVLCACGVPAGLGYVACKGCCRGVRGCLCDVPALCLGAPAFTACSLVEFALCDAPAALCRLPARLTAAAAQLALQDARALLQAVDICAERFLQPFRGLEQEEGQ